MRKEIAGLCFFFLFFIIIPPVTGEVRAAYFQFEPTSLTVATGQTVSIKVNVNAGNDQLSSVDVYVLYDSTYLKVQSVTADSYFPTVSNDASTAGKVYIAGMVDDPATSTSGSGTLATIVFQGLKDGEVSLTIDCNLSKMVKNDINATNVMECSSNGSATVVVGTGSSSSQNSTSSSDSSSSSPQQLPKTGVFDHVVKWSVPGMILLFIGGALKIIL